MNTFHPELIRYNSLKPEEKEENLELAFSVAAKVGIPRFLDPEDSIIFSTSHHFMLFSFLSILLLFLPNFSLQSL
jgi:Calponin homology (CH) domain